MSATPCFRRLAASHLPQARRAALGLLVALACSRAGAVDVSGVYADAGTSISAASDQAAGQVSLEGLFRLEFDATLARARYSQTAQAVVVQTASAFKVWSRDADGGTTWSGRWAEGQGYARMDGCVDLRLRAQRFGYDEFVFHLSTVGDGTLLLVEVLRVTPTLIGPSIKPVGEYLFPRLPAK